MKAAVFLRLVWRDPGAPPGNETNSSSGRNIKTLRDISSQMGISYAYAKVLQNNAFAKIKKIFENQ